MLYFVTEVITTGVNKSVEVNTRVGGYKGLSSATRTAKRKGNCIIRDSQRNIVGQTIKASLPFYV